MAFEKEKQFLEKMMADEELRSKVEAAEPEQILEIANAAGFDINGEDLEKAAKEARAKADPAVDKMSVEDMDKVAGGQFWQGEVAWDGHEMGCTAFYHDEGWQLRYKVECNENYYCMGDYYTGSGVVIL